MNDNTKHPTLFDPPPANGRPDASPPNEERPGYKFVKRIGWIPEDWEVKPIKTVIRRGSGVTYGVVQPGDFVPGGPIMIRSQDYASGWVSTDDMYRISKKLDHSYERSRVKEGDLLLTVVGANVGKVAVVPYWLDGQNISRAVARLRICDSRADSYYIRSYLESGNGNRLVYRHQRGGAQPVINLSEVERFEIVLPPLPEQRKIARILGAWDRALADLDALLAAMRRRKQGLAQRLLTGRVRLPGFDEPWREVQLGKLFRQRKETGREDLQLLSVTADQGIVPQDSLDRKDTSASDKSRYLRVAPGDIAYNTMRMWQGVSALSKLEGIVSPAYTVLQPTKRIDALFASYLFQLPGVIHLFYRYSQGLVSDTLNLKYRHFAQIKVTIPASVEEQRRIAAVLDAADAEIAALEAWRAALARQKKGLMQRLLTGEIRVRPEEGDNPDLSGLRDLNRSTTTPTTSTTPTTPHRDNPDLSGLGDLNRSTTTPITPRRDNPAGDNPDLNRSGGGDTS